LSQKQPVYYQGKDEVKDGFKNAENNYPVKWGNAERILASGQNCIGTEPCQDDDAEQGERD
jgi:hypothetical protein